MLKMWARLCAWAHFGIRVTFIFIHAIYRHHAVYLEIVGHILRIKLSDAVHSLVILYTSYLYTHIYIVSYLLTFRCSHISPVCSLICSSFSSFHSLFISFLTILHIVWPQSVGIPAFAHVHIIQFTLCARQKSEHII